MTTDPTNDPRLAARVPVPDGHPFPIQNLPYGAFVRGRERRARLGVAIGDAVLDLAQLARDGVFDSAIDAPSDVLCAPRLNPLLARGPLAWSAVRARVSELLRAESPISGALLEAALVPATDVRLELPIDVGDYVDFYSSRYHAENVGRLFRPGADLLTPNWRWMPVGYHGRSSGVVTSGTPIVRPNGQRAPDASGDAPAFGPCRMLDFELELGFVTGDGPNLGTPLSIKSAPAAIFGIVLLNDWSARDVQAWENQPLGPFLSKAFATSISPWVVTTAALAPFAVDSADPPPAVLAHLRGAPRAAYDIALEAEVIAAESCGSAVVTLTNAKHLFWSMPQQLAHLASCGARVRAGDLFGTGTISGPGEEAAASLLELSARGARPLAVGTTSRTFLEDGDEVVIRGTCSHPRARTIGFGELRGRVNPAVDAHSNDSDIVPASPNPSSR